MQVRKKRKNEKRCRNNEKRITCPCCFKLSCIIWREGIGDEASFKDLCLPFCLQTHCIIADVYEVLL